MQLTLLRSFVDELVQAEEVRLRRAVNVVPPDQAETIPPHVKFSIFTSHRRNTVGWRWSHLDRGMLWSDHSPRTYKKAAKRWEKIIYANVNWPGNQPLCLCRCRASTAVAHNWNQSPALGGKNGNLSLAVLKQATFCKHRVVRSWEEILTSYMYYNISEIRIKFMY